MKQLRDFADDRLVRGCIYCGGAFETRDHVPSRVFLEPPFPENLPVVGSCRACNQSYSKDEQYLACMVEAALAGTANPDKIRRRSIAQALRRSPALQARIAAAKQNVDDQFQFNVEEERVSNVMLKLARGHAAFELSQPCRDNLDHFWCGSLALMSRDVREAFDAPHVQQMFGEVGSRGLQRLLVTQLVLKSPAGEEYRDGVLLNDWVDVQEGCYRYLAIDDAGCIAIRIVVAEYLACEVGWLHHVPR